MEFLDWFTEIYAHGAAKYDWDNWMTLDADRMADATFRHIKHHIEDRQAGIIVPTDKDSKYSALAHVACGALMTLWLCYQELEEDLDKEYGPVEEPEPVMVQCICVDGPMAGHRFTQNSDRFRKEARFPHQTKIGDSPNIYVYEYEPQHDAEVTLFRYKHSLGVTT